MALKDSYKFGRNFKFWMHARDTSIPGNLPDARVLIGSLLLSSPLAPSFLCSCSFILDPIRLSLCTLFVPRASNSSPHFICSNSAWYSLGLSVKVLIFYIQFDIGNICIFKYYAQRDSESVYWNFPNVRYSRVLPGRQQAFLYIMY